MSPDLHHLSGAYAVDALDDAERTEFERHLAVCAACRAEVAELGGAAHALGALTEATPPEGLRDSVLTGIARVRPLPPIPAPGGDDHPRADGADVGPVTPGSPVVIPFLRRTSTWLVAAAAVALLAVGGLAWQQPWRAAEPTLTAIEQVQEAPDATTVSRTSDGLTATLAYSRELDRSAISVTGLPPVPAGSTYQLWYVGPDQVARSAGFLDADSGSGSVLLEGQVDGAAAVGMTVEPAGGSAAPTTDPVVVVPLT